MEQKQYDDPVKSPVVQEIILCTAKRLDVEPLRALLLFYRSQTCRHLHDKRTGLYLYSDGYIADETMREFA